MRVIFFEIDAINVKRYYLDVLPDILKNADIVILIEGTEEAKKLKEMGIQFPIVVLEDSTVSILEELIINSDIVFINGQRIPDIMLTLLVNKYEKKTVYLQHGMYIPYMKRGLLFYIKSLFKSLRYLKYSVYASMIDENPKLLFNLIRSHLIDGVREYGFNKFIGFPDMSFVFSEYWQEWHKKHYFNNNYNRFSIVGNPEPMRFEKQSFGSNYITYCYQTLIEDGRIEKKYLFGVFNEIIKWASKNGKTLIVKTHPRMSAEVMNFFKYKDIELIDNTLPVTDIVIGHYSSLMPLWSYLGSKVFSLKLNGHQKNIDESIENTTYRIDSLDEILESISANASENDTDQYVKYYFNYNPSYSINVMGKLKNILE